MKNVEFTEDYKIAEMPSHGSRIVDAKKGDVESVSNDLFDLIVAAGKGKENVENEENKDDNGKGEGEGSEGNSENPPKPSFLASLNPATKDKANAEN